MWLPRNASKARLREAENARRNRAEIVAARSAGQVTRRDLIKMGILTTGGFLALKNGLSPFAKSAYADNCSTVTCMPLTPYRLLGSNKPYTVDMLRPHTLTRHKLTKSGTDSFGHPKLMWPAGSLTDPTGAAGLMPVGADEVFSTRQANTTSITHTCFLANPGDPTQCVVKQRDWPTSGLMGPREGRPPGEFFAHQRWDELINGTVARFTDHAAVGLITCHGELFDGFSYHLANSASAVNPGGWPVQNTRAIWTPGEGRFVRGGNWVPKDGKSLASGVGDAAFPALFQGRIGEMMVLRNYNNLPFDPADNGGYGRNEPTTHNHNAHNGAESDGAGNAHFFPGEYYDYVWSGMLARTDAGMKMSRAVQGFNGLSNDLDSVLNIKRGDARASSPTDNGDILLVPGDFREFDGTMWFHDHRIAYTSENVYKGYASLLIYYSGPDRGYERPGLSTVKRDTNGKSAESINLRYPSGWRRKDRKWGNQDFDIYFLVQDVTFSTGESTFTDPSYTPPALGQQLFDNVGVDGFLGDTIHVNFQWKPVLKVLPRKYRFRILSAGMSRWIKLAIADGDKPGANPLPFTMIANDGNLFPTFNGTTGITALPEQGTAERYDIIVDFSRGQSPASQVGKKYFLVNLLHFSNPLRDQKALTLGQALSEAITGTSFDGTPGDPGVGPIMQFQVVDSVPSVDDPTTVNTIANACGANDMSLKNPPGADWEIPTVEPVRTRTIELLPDDTEDSGLPFDHPTNNPPPPGFNFGNEHWAVQVTTDLGSSGPHHTDMRRASNLPRPGDVEHWTLKSGTNWFHPLHLHFEEAKTLNRDGKTDPGSIHPGELNKRKDVWHVGSTCCDGSSPTIQVTFGEFGGAYVNHCHNTVHEDNAMLIHYHLIRGNSNDSGIDDVHATVLPTPDPRVTGVTYVESCTLHEADPQVLAEPTNTGVPECPNVLGPVTGGQGGPVGLPITGGPVDANGYIDLTGFTIP